MADLIDRTTLFADIDESIVFSSRINTNAEMRGANKIVDRIKSAKAVDAVEVVRCKDCIHMENSAQFRHCRVWGAINGMGDEGFCNYGERRTDSATD